MARSAGRKGYRSALRIIVIYGVFAGLWIYLSDTLLGTFVKSPDTMVRISVLKGFLFIAVTGTFLYFLIANHIRRSQRFAAGGADRARADPLRGG